MNNPAKILVVDDTPANVKLLSDLLTYKGYEVVTAASGIAQCYATIGAIGFEGRKDIAKIRDQEPSRIHDRDNPEKETF